MWDEELLGEALPEDEELVPSLCLEELLLSMGLMSQEPDCSGCRNTLMVAAAIAFVYSDAVEVEVLMVEVAVTESGVASLGGVGGNVNMGCEAECCGCSDLAGADSSQAAAAAPKGAHQLLPNELTCDDCLPSDADTGGFSHGMVLGWWNGGGRQALREAAAASTPTVRSS